jgi:hypothetical protein
MIKAALVRMHNNMHLIFERRGFQLIVFDIFLCPYDHYVVLGN